MTDVGVFKILLENQKLLYEIDYPKQQFESVKLVSKQITQFIYENLRKKSVASSNKQSQLLKFLNQICEIPESYTHEEYINCFINKVRIHNIDNKQIEVLEKEIADDLDKYKQCEQKLYRFYAKKNARSREKESKINFINTIKQEKLGKKYSLEIERKYMFEINENLLQKMLGLNCNNLVAPERITNYLTCKFDRNTQIKLAYALYNLNHDFIKQIFSNLLNYDKLSKAEKNFLQYIWYTNDDNHLDIGDYIELFYPLIESSLIKFATDLLGLDDDSQIDQYFIELRNNRCVERIKKICKQNYNCYVKLKTLLYELYCLSYCNENILKIEKIIS